MYIYDLECMYLYIKTPLDYNETRRVLNWLSVIQESKESSIS